MDKQRHSTIYQIIHTSFCVIVVLSNLLCAKFFTLPFFAGVSLPAGLITYPLTFLLSDLVTEVYGARKARLMVYSALGTSLLSCCIIQCAIYLPTEDLSQQLFFESIFGVNGLVVCASLMALTVAQLLDIYFFSLIKKWTGERWLFMRNNGSTLLAQIVDTLIVNVIYLYWGLSMEGSAVLNVIFYSYLYKVFFSLTNIPLFYGAVSLFKPKLLRSEAL